MTDDLDLLDLPDIRATLRQAWEDSQPGVSGGHEEGGFIVQDAAGDISVIRWPRGDQDTIILPPYDNCRVGGKDILATFHTHPNTGANYLQEPSETDRQAVREDPDLKGEGYQGEFVISSQIVFQVTPNGQMHELGMRDYLLRQNSVTLLEDGKFLEED